MICTRNQKETGYKTYKALTVTRTNCSGLLNFIQMKKLINLYFKYRFKIKYFFYLRKIKKADKINKTPF